MKNLRPGSAELTQAWRGQANVLEEHSGSQGSSEGRGVRGPQNARLSERTATPVGQSGCQVSKFQRLHQCYVSYYTVQLTVVQVKLQIRPLGPGIYVPK